MSFLSGPTAGRTQYSSHLLTAFLVTLILNSYTIEGYTIINVQEPSTEPTIDILSNGSENQKHDPYIPYMKGMTSPLDEGSLEYSLDYYNEKAQMKELDFDPVVIVKKLANSAMMSNTTANQFLEDLQDLISLQNRSRTETDETPGRDDTSKLPAGFSENLIKRMTEGWKNELKRLETKYNVSSECTGPESVTATRLSLMFPHYLNFGQKPFANPTEITLRQGSYDRYNSYSNDVRLPSYFNRHEFGGLIPQYPTHMQEEDWRAIIGTHLYALYKESQNDNVPFRTKCVMLRRRMNKSMLSEDRRIRFLLNNDVLKRNGQLLKTAIKTGFSNIPSDFKEKIDWSLFGKSINVA